MKVSAIQAHRLLIVALDSLKYTDNNSSAFSINNAGRLALVQEILNQQSKEIVDLDSGWRDDEKPDPETAPLTGKG